MKALALSALVVSLTWLVASVEGRLDHGRPVADSEAAIVFGGSCAQYDSTGTCNNGGAAGCPCTGYTSCTTTGGTGSGTVQCTNSAGTACGSLYYKVVGCKG